MGFLQKFKVFATVLFLTFTSSFAIAKMAELPDNMIWSCYDVGSSGYVQASAVANAFLKQYDKRVRLIPSGTSIGRIIPLVSGKASVGFLANEAFFASEGSYDFATYEWGPQDLRAILGRPTSFPLITTKVSGIKTLADLKGKRVSWVVGNPSLNIKMTGFLAFAGLTWNDVIKVPFPSYADSLRALIQGNVDAADGSTTASILYELDSSTKGVYYPELPPEDKEGWKRLRKVIPFGFPYKENIGAGINKDKPLWLLGYKYPIITVRKDADVDFVYNFIKAMDETYSLYKDAASSMEGWEITQSGKTPIDVPFHEGAIKYLKEKGLWTAEDEEWQNQRIAELEILKKEWLAAVKYAKSNNLSQESFRKYWMEKLDSLKK